MIRNLLHWSIHAATVRIHCHSTPACPRALILSLSTQLAASTLVPSTSHLHQQCCMNILTRISWEPAGELPPTHAHTPRPGMGFACPENADHHFDSIGPNRSSAWPHSPHFRQQGMRLLYLCQHSASSRFLMFARVIGLSFPPAKYRRRPALLSGRTTRQPLSFALVPAASLLSHFSAPTCVFQQGSRGIFIQSRSECIRFLLGTLQWLPLAVKMES